MPGPYINQAPVDDGTDMGQDNQRPQGTDPQTMAILSRILSLLQAQTQPPPMPPDMGGMGMPPGMGMGGAPPMPGPGMPPPMGAPGMGGMGPPPGMGQPPMGMPPPPMPGGPGGGMGMPPGLGMGQPPMPPPPGPGGMPFTQYMRNRPGM